MDQPQTINADVLVIGSGLAGCIAAMTAADLGRQVVLVTRSAKIQSGSSAWAQGGIVFKGEGDSRQCLKDDIINASGGHSYEPAVDQLCNMGPELVERWLLDRLKVPFSKSEQGAYSKTAEAAHSVPRILYAADHTGKTITQKLVEGVVAHENVTVMTDLTAVELLTTNHHSLDLNDTYEPARCFGARFWQREDQKIVAICAEHTILATGGLGQLFLHTTNPRESRGDGIAMAYRAGARCVNLEYIQFHPTKLYHDKERFLVSEAVRGEGGELVDGSGTPFMKRFHELGSLAPRDVVARAIHQVMLEQSAKCVYLDIRHKDEVWLKERFPSIWSHLESIGINMSTDLIPVVPAAHYAIGGVAVDLNGKTSLARLYAVGETACTGVHGANRLASTSLLECLVWGYLAGQKAGDNDTRLGFPEFTPWRYESGNIDPALVAQDWQTLRNIMWNYVGLVRTPHRLARAEKMLRELLLEVEEFYKKATLSDSVMGLRHGIQTALAVTLSAAKAKVSRGSHYVVK
ncbi:MAG: L-aspartate oxidase [Myxococcales bacterium]|nr:L-aspartate oxidase [Myxococcales bacterium]